MLSCGAVHTVLVQVCVRHVDLREPWRSRHELVVVVAVSAMGPFYYQSPCLGSVFEPGPSRPSVLKCYPSGWLARVHRGLSPYNLSIGAMPNQRRLPGELGNSVGGVA